MMKIGGKTTPNKRVLTLGSSRPADQPQQTGVVVGVVLPTPPPSTLPRLLVQIAVGGIDCNHSERRCYEARQAEDSST
jgi:hypothetical protein